MRLWPLSVILALASPGPATAGGRVFGDFSAGGEYDDSVLRDSSARRDKSFPAHLGVGWRGRLSRLATGRAYYRFSIRRYARQTRETHYTHVGEAGLRHRLAGALTLLLEMGAEAYRQPGLNRFDSNRVIYKPGIEWRPLADTRLSVFLTHETERYPRSDLDSRAPGFEAELRQDITLSGRLSLRYDIANRRFSERRLFRDAGAALLDEKRRDIERELEAELEGDWRYGGALVGYSWLRLTSNGNFVDFGPNQSLSNNPTPGDERLIADYYSRKAQGPHLEGRLGRPEWLSVFVSHRWQDVSYDGRIAKNAADQFVAGAPRRSDRRRILTVRLTRVLLTDPVSTSLLLSWTRESSRSNDSLYTFINDRYAVSLRGRF